MENGILLPTLQSALPFLDLHGTPRLEFHQSVFDELRDKLMERVVTIAEGKEEDRYFNNLFFFLYKEQEHFPEGPSLDVTVLVLSLCTDMGNLKSFWRRAFHLSKCRPFSLSSCRC